MDAFSLLLLTLAVLVLFARAVNLRYRDLSEEEARVNIESAFLKEKGWIPVGMWRDKEMWYSTRTDSMHERFTALYIAQSEEFEAKARQLAREVHRKENEHGGK